MANKRQSPAMTIILIAIIVVAVFFIVRPIRPSRPPLPVSNWTCEECDYRFVAPRSPGRAPIECQACGGLAVETQYFYCRACAHQFEGYRTKPPVDEMALVGIYKVPGGEWIAGVGPPVVSCPICGDNRALELVRPES